MPPELTSAERAAERAAQARDASLDRHKRRSEGIVHTPAVLARFVARASDELLRGELGLAGGVADPALAIVDPACGPGAFLAAVQAVGAGRGTAPAVLLGIDRDAVALGRASTVIAEAAWPVRLTHADTLSAIEPRSLAELAPAVLVIGNPPWIASAQARPSPWLDALLDDFRRDGEGAPLGERKLGVLADAYVRFLRWASELARLARRGAVVAFVTNASYLDGPVHRGMRAALLRYFDALHLVDLGGNALLSRSGPRDENVFGVRPGVAVLFAVRRAGRDESSPARVRYLRALGPAQEKLAKLEVLALDGAPFRSLPAAPPLCRFVPTAAASDEYAGWPSLPELLPFHREGVQTNRDEIVIDRDRDALLVRLRAFADGEALPELALANRALAHYDPERARAAVREALAVPRGDAESPVRRIAYRPFDERWFLPLAPLCHRPRPELLAAVGRSPLALVTVRKDRGSAPWSHFFAVEQVPDNCLLSARSSCRARAFPTHLGDGRENLGPAALRWSERVGRELRAEEVVRYVLSVLASGRYRKRHQEALHVDYPRIPPPLDAAAFDDGVRAGRQLCELFTRPLPGEGGGALSQVTYEPATGEVRGDRELLHVFAQPAPSVGHHDPLRAFLQARAGTPIDRAPLLELCGRLHRLNELVAELAR